jgi:membrane-associated phospholipid phosphatase
MTGGDPIWHWPSWQHWCHYLMLSAAVGIWFAIVYVGADWFADQHGYRVRLHLDSDLAVPFVPAAVAGYMSIYSLFAAVPFVLRTKRECDALAGTMAAVIAFAGVCFLLFPADSAFTTTHEMGAWAGMVRFAKWVALTHNFAPSLHVALSTLCVIVFARRAPPTGRVALWLWAGIVGLSTMLLHQHYMIDVVTGYLLAWAGVRVVYDRWRNDFFPNSAAQPGNESSAAGLTLPARTPR